MIAVGFEHEKDRARAFEVLCMLGAPLSPASPDPLALLFPSGLKETHSNARVGVYVADGGLATLARLSQMGTRLPLALSHRWIWVGDGDSLEASGFGAPDASALVHAGVALEKTLLPKDKDLSDFGALADRVNFDWESACASGPVPLHLHVLAGLGGRHDHELCNLLEACDLLGRVAEHGMPGLVSFYSAECSLEISLAAGRIGLRAAPGTPFTLAPLRGKPDVAIKGARWPGLIAFTRGSRGLSNAFAQGEPLVTLNIERGVCAILPA